MMNNTLQEWREDASWAEDFISELVNRARRKRMILLPKLAAASKGVQASAISFQTIIAVVTFLRTVLGPAALPYVESWLATLNLPPATLAEIDAVLEAIFRPASIVNVP